MGRSVFIDGEWRASDGEAFQSIAPATNNVIWEEASATAGDVDAAVSAARKAFAPWAMLSADERIVFVRAYREAVEAAKDALADVIAEETGKPLWEAKTEAGAVVGKVEISIKAYEERTGVKESPVPGGRAVLRHKPHGVLAVLGPYNFPAHLPNGHIVPALIAGNTVVLKPSEITPKTAEFMVGLWETAGLPAGVVNLVQGAAQTGMALTAHDGLDGVLFTGSARTGVALHKQFAGRPGFVLALEMGGNNPLIVDDVNDIEAAALATIQSAYLTAGQRCTCARRLLVPTGAAGDAFIERLASMIDKIIVGAPKDEPAPFMGPVVSNRAADGLVAGYEAFLAAGGQALRPLVRRAADLPFLSPALVDVTDATGVPDEEHFGPILQVRRVSDFDAAIEEANNTQYGLSAGLISDDRAKYDTFLVRSRAGIVNWNNQTTGAAGTAPFGGIGLSGNHNPSAYYAADYCAYPVASMERDATPSADELPTGFAA